MITPLIIILNRRTNISEARLRTVYHYTNGPSHSTFIPIVEPLFSSCRFDLNNWTFFYRRHISTTTVDSEPPPSSRTSGTFLTPAFSIFQLLKRVFSGIPTIFIFKINMRLRQINDAIFQSLLLTMRLAKFFQSQQYPL
jgi:hypothetical protein